MDTSSLVKGEFDSGQKLLEQLVNDDFNVTIAFWIRFKFEEEGPWFYIVSDTIEQKGLLASYRDIHESLRRIPSSWRPWDAVAEIAGFRLVGPQDPVARDVLAIRDQYPGSNRIRGIYIASQLVEELVIYQYDLGKIFFAIMQLGSAKVGVPFLYMKKEGKAWSASAQWLIALEILRRELKMNVSWCAYSPDEWSRFCGIGPESTAVKKLLGQVVEAVYPLIFPAPMSDREQDEARAFEKLGPVFWGLKAEMEKRFGQLGQFGDQMAQQLRQIWPEPPPQEGAKAD